MNLTVGQIVYLLTKKSPNPKVYPALVCEEIQKRSLQGKTVNYVIRLPTDDRREIEVDNIDAEIFESIEEARDAMFKRAKDSIEEILDVAEKMSNIFKEETEMLQNSESLTLEPEASGLSAEGQGYASVDLGDGNVARISIDEINKMNEVPVE